MQRQRLCRLRTFHRRLTAHRAYSDRSSRALIAIFRLDFTKARRMIAETKCVMRAEMLHRRGGFALAGAAAALADQVLTRCRPPPGTTIAGFWPMGDEIDIRPLLHALHALGHVLLLPVTPPRGQALLFRRWAPGSAMEPGRFGTQHPAATEAATPDTLLVPLLAFDLRGHRLGYGGGYYDRTLAALPHAFRLGVAYAAQQVPAVPAGPHDVTLHAIATESGVLRVVAGAGQD